MQKNIKIKPNYSLFAIFALSTGILISGCAKNGNLQETKTPEEIVKERAIERWNHMISRDFDKVYDLTDSSYRLIHTSSDLDRKYGGKKFSIGVNWKEAEFVSIECKEENRCISKFLITTEANIPPNFRNITIPKTPIEEIWIKEDNNWFYYMKN